MTTYKNRPMKLVVSGPVNLTDLEIPAGWSVEVRDAKTNHIFMLWHYPDEESANEAVAILAGVIGTAVGLTIPKY